MAKQLPHLRRVDGHWLCTHDRTERHFLRGYWGSTPMQAYQNFTFHQHMKEIGDKWKSSVAWKYL